MQRVIDQMVHELADYSYEQVTANAASGEDGPDTYTGNVGIAP
ncbi:conserved hypothetical protein [Pantoea brenneri]|uniref:Uncharacterized protein n=1 Tax=Pantoea brenneri TaxID=472694 RepID=A0AAX3JA45_9GAMM|nr:conserved hypothetical protein [Pantoea brenneri]